MPQRNKQNAMWLKFIGKDGSMGLRHGKTYSVRVYSSQGYIWADWCWKACPYSSPQAFAANWTRP